MSKSVENSNQQSTPVDEATKFFLGAKSALKIGDMGAAERLLRKALDLSTDNYLYMLTLARLLVQMDKNHSESENLLLQSSLLNITAVEPRLILSALYEKQGRNQETQAVLKSVINLEPKNFVARRKLTQLKGEVSIEDEQILLRDEIFAQCKAFEYNDLPPLYKIQTDSNLIEESQKENVFELKQPNLSYNEPLTNESLNEPLTNEPLTTYTENLSTEVEQSDTIGKLLVNLPSEPRHIEYILNAATEPLNPNLFSSIPLAENILSTPAVEEALAIEEAPAKSSQSIWESQSEDTKIEVFRLEIDKLLNIIRRFFEGVKESLGEDTAFLLIKRAKMQIETLYPELDYFDIVENEKVVGCSSSDQYVGKRSLEAIATWMYLYMTLLSETAILREEAGIRVIEQVLIENSEFMEEQLFYRYFTDIQV